MSEVHFSARGTNGVRRYRALWPQYPRERGGQGGGSRRKRAECWVPRHRAATLVTGGSYKASTYSLFGIMSASTDCDQPSYRDVSHSDGVEVFVRSPGRLFRINPAGARRSASDRVTSPHVTLTGSNASCTSCSPTRRSCTRGRV